jgi:hypothetical protein
MSALTQTTMQRTYLDDTDSDGLPHVSDSESTEGRVVSVRLNAQRLLGDKLDDGGISRLDKLGVYLHCFARPLMVVSVCARDEV